MKRILKSQRGASLVEILVSIGIVMLFLAAAASTILNSQFLASYSRHKIQAMYVAQQLVEQQRRYLWASIISVASTPVTLDTQGTGSAADDFMGNSVITVSTLDAFRKSVQVEINWREHVLNGNITIREFYTTNIANDPIPN